jgi:hypothetical protein
MLTSDKEITIAKIISSLYNFALGDIKKSLKEDMLIGTFVLCTCLIDSLVQHRYFQQNITTVELACIKICVLKSFTIILEIKFMR